MVKKQIKFKEKVAFVTGAGGDIGREISIALAQEKYIVVCIDIDPIRNAQTVAVITELGFSAIALDKDVTDLKQVTRAVKKTLKLGSLSCIINGVGQAYSLNQVSTSEEQWKFEQNLNLNTVFNVVKGFEEYLKQGNDCSIINIASVNGLGVYGNTAYSVARAAVIHYTRLLAVEFAKYNCRVNCVAPGTVKTQAWNKKLAKNPNALSEVSQWYALKKVANPSDIANAVIFLTSARAAAITGVVLPVDCGLTAGIKVMADSFSQGNF